MSKSQPGSPDAIRIGAVSIETSDFVSQGNAILGIRDSGKSYTATFLAEQLLAREIPFVAFDPIGVWRFLRHGARQWHVIVAGGEASDVGPLNETTAPIILRHAMKQKLPLIFDLYDMSMSKAQWRRIVTECVEILLYENKSHGPRHIFLEEAAEFVPQQVTSEYSKVYSAIEKLARMGGNSMLGYTLINQRAEQLNKAVLELCDCLFLHRQKGRLSLTALEKWLSFGDKKSGAEVIESLPMLEQGECWVWKGGDDKPRRTHTPKKESYHPNRRHFTDPGPASKLPASWLSGLDLANEETKENVPSYYLPTPNLGRPAPSAQVEVPVFAPGDLVKLDLLYRQFDEATTKLAEISRQAEATAREIKGCLQRAEALRAPRYTAPPIVRDSGRPTTMSRGPQRILATLAARHPLRLTQAQLGTLAGFTPSTMRTYLPGLRDAGYLEETSDGMSLTAAGLDTAGRVTEQMPTNGRGLLEFWKTRLSQGEGAILESLWKWGNTHVNPPTPEQLSRETGYTDSTLRTYLPVLRRNNLIDQAELKISPEFLK